MEPSGRDINSVGATFAQRVSIESPYKTDRRVLNGLRNSGSARISLLLEVAQGAEPGYTWLGISHLREARILKRSVTQYLKHH